MKDEEIPAGRELDARVHTRLFNGEAGPEADVPYYSTDLAASFQLVGELQRLGYRVDVSYWAEQPLVTLTSPLDDPRTFAGETPAEALCHAALGVTAEE